MLSPLLTLGRRWTFVGGKGGVGKTTVAAALALELADAGEDVLVVSVDPAHSLGDALKTTLGPEPRPIPGAERLHALEVDGEYERRRFAEEHGAALSTLIQRGTYLDADDLDLAGDLGVPGMDEIAALLRLSRSEREFGGRLIIDTAPTGHTLRLLDLPDLAGKWIEALEAMDAKRQAVATAFTGAHQHDLASELLIWLRSETDRVASLLGDSEATRFILVTTSDSVVRDETLLYLDGLRQRGVAAGGLVANYSVGPAPAAAGDGPSLVLSPTHSSPVVGLDGLRTFSAAVIETTDGAALPSSATAKIRVRPVADRIVVGRPFTPPLDRRLYFVGGKGGVGKSTTAAALAIRLVDMGRAPVLLLSVDPAGSLESILGMTAPDPPTPGSIRPVPGVDDLFIRQLDAAGAWDSFRERYLVHLSELFDWLLPAGGRSAVLDRAVLERVIDLAPAGVDELVALMEVIDLTEDRAYDGLVVDTAPTGHFLRLLEMPQLALDWCHLILRLLLEYQDAVPLGEFGERVLRLSRSLREFSARLRDESETWFLAVALPEDLSIPETRRLLDGTGRVELQAGALLVNRVLDPSGRPHRGVKERLEALLGSAPEVPSAAGPLLHPPPTGPDALRAFGARWREVGLG